MTLASHLRAMFEIGRHPLRLIQASARDANKIVIETIAFETASGERVRGIVTRPFETSGRLPAILYIHAHGARHDIGAAELIDGRPALQSALGPVFAEAGYVTLTIDLPCFGERAATSEASVAKALLWEGRSLAGQMLGELSSAFDYLMTRTDVDSARIGVFGLSMGATFSYWLAAVEPRIACVMHLCCFADFRQLIATGAHGLHGVYLTVPGLLTVAGNGVIAGLIAPRPQLICIGNQDPLTPPHAFDPAFEQTAAAYEKAGARARLHLHREPHTGHQESTEMRRLMLGFAAAHLQGAPN